MVYRALALITRILSSRRFVYGIFIFFAIEGLWIAFSAVYPMAFDENFHFGLIKIYSHHWLPFLQSQPDGANQFGAVARDPSYLYHWLMSFPYRLVALCTDSQTAQVIVLRLINIALFGLGLMLFRRLLQKVGMTTAFINTALLLFILIPIVPLVAGQINYDNLLMPLVAGTCLLAYNIYQGLVRRKLVVASLAWLVVISMLGSLVKYAFLPIVLTVWLFLLAVALRTFRGHFKWVWPEVKASFSTLGRTAKVGFAIIFVLSTVLFVQRYGLNLSAYHTPVPDCAKVLSNDACLSYGPWARNYHAAQQKPVVSHNPIAYSWTWLQGMHYRLLFMINGPNGGYTNYPPSPLVSAATISIVVFGVAAVAFYGKRAARGVPFVWFLLALALVYVLVLWVDNYTQFLETGQPVAINGRYLLPILFPGIVVVGRSLSMALRSWPTPKAACALFVVLMFLQGGGVFGFIARSDEHWYWPNRLVVDINNGARIIVTPLIIEGSRKY